MLGADHWAPNLTAAATWDSNASNANLSTDQIDSLRLSADVLASGQYPLGRDDTAHVTARVGGEWWPRYDALASALAGGRLEWRHTFGPGPLAPTLSLQGAAEAVTSRETGRRGVGYGFTVSGRKRFNDFTRGTIAHEVSWLDAEAGVYDRGASETSVELERDLGALTRLTLTARFRDGDIVSYAAAPRPDLAAIAPQQLDTDTFERPMTAHRIDARTWSARGAFIRALDDSSAVVVSYEFRATKRAPLSFANHLFSVALVHQF